jgi:hypothetical protein
MEMGSDKNVSTVMQKAFWQSQTKLGFFVDWERDAVVTVVDMAE